MSALCDVFLRHAARVLRGLGNRHRRERDLVGAAPRSRYRDCALLEVALQRGLDCGLPGRERLAGIRFGGDARKRALQISERVGADTLYVRVLLQVSGEVVA